MDESSNAVVVTASATRKVFKPSINVVNKIPEALADKINSHELTQVLPKNYNFELPKTIWRIKQIEAKRVALQMPEGLLMFATTICDIIEEFTEADTVIMGDVTYGACCIDDYTAKALRVDLLVHYGHSCLIPVDQTIGIKVLYIFVDIKIDSLHFLETIQHNFPKEEKIGLVSTIQFVATLHAVGRELRELGYKVTIPQSRPLSAGEILGCTSPTIKDVNVLIYLGDGRFHLEAAMIANPSLRAFRYDPYEKKFTEEFYDHSAMLKIRTAAIQKASEASRFGLILGTLGRQGNPKVLATLQERISLMKKESTVVLLSEIFPDKLKMFPDVEAWIQIACPRLSIDWGYAFTQPLLTPFEAAVALGSVHWRKDEDRYPMDFYANTSLGPWTPNHKTTPDKDDTKCCGKTGCSPSQATGKH
ncbi:2-(3-amino-3-carboxypropyl)histidine synthase subunit 1 [Schistocerca americana]|uniref:2-(3-amino-3-carboxypropyl)histidine synthase subunit 1 n=1 Tax=Schistocerca americana TaxID=7009 RepID=UPI001F4FDD31|nr:2-(3-amino-3-carboxypropyl)histidine synthase subunit 1 [Schistocerca americana]